MRKQIPISISALLILICISAGLCFALNETINKGRFVVSHTFRNELETSGVEVKLETSGGGLAEPGQIVNYSPTIKNMNAGSFIRISFDSDPEDVIGLTDHWVKRGHYYYCTKPFSKGERINLFSQIRIPRDLGNGNMKYRIRATVDGIQAKNFKPDFGNISPWGTVEIQQSDISNAEVKVNKGIKIASPDFSYIRPGTFECSTKDLFSKFDKFQPGDVCSETLNMRNYSGGTMHVYFRTENNGTDLLEKMQLKISCCGDPVYEGTLASERLNNFRKIAKIYKGRRGNLKFEISMPKSADNSYAMLEDNVTWVIAIKEDTSRRNIRTGEENLPIKTIAIIAAVSASLIIILLTAYGIRKSNLVNSQ